MTTRGKLFGWLLLGLLGGLLGQGCGSSETRPPRRSMPVAGTGGKDGMTMTVEPAGGQGGNGGLSPYDDLCGIRSESCVPDESTNDQCKPSIGTGPSPVPGVGGSAGSGGGTPTTPQGGESAAIGAGAAAGEVGNAGQSGAPGGQGGEAPGQAGAAGAPTATPDNGGNDAAGGEAGRGAAGLTAAGRGGGGVSGTASANAGTAGLTVSTLSLTSCQVTEDPKHRGRPLAQCLPAGNGIEGDPCFSGADCRGGLACVGEGPGQCRPYCCSGNGACRDRTHCTAEPLLAPSARTTLEVPVCMPVVNCSLAEPPCVEGATCSCPVGSACVVVGSDGTTSCVNTDSLPSDDEGTEGLPCPCGWGYVCSQATNTCVKLCQIGAPDLYCGGARCQPGTTLPLGWGTCVGTPPKGSSAP